MKDLNCDIDDKIIEEAALVMFGMGCMVWVCVCVMGRNGGGGAVR